MTIFKPRVLFCWSALLLAGAIWALAAGQPAALGLPGQRNPSSQPARPELRAAAIVNGEPISESELLAALPKDVLDAALDEARKTRLDRLLELALRDQFLRAHKIVVPEAELDKRFEDHKQRVMTQGCGCCGTIYATFGQYLEANYSTMADLRRLLRCQAGFELYLDQAMTERLAPHGTADAVMAGRAEIEKEFVKGSMMMFDFREDPDFDNHPQIAQAHKEKAAAEAFQHLQKGEPFDKVGEKMSDHLVAAETGGSSACLPANVLSDETRAAWLKLAPGTYCAPFKSAEGFRIIKRDALTDADVFDLMKRKVASEVAEQVSKEFAAYRGLAKIQMGPLPMPATADPPPVRQPTTSADQPARR